jgi:hypothetical protein
VSEEDIFLNGINALTGEYLAPPLSVAEAAQKAQRNSPATGLSGWLRGFVKRITGGRLFGLPSDVDARDLSQSGWGVVLAKGLPESVRDGLKPLIEHRTRQVGPLFKELEYRPGESREQWLNRHGANGSDVEPTRVPYYLLLVGHPSEIPFEFQYELDVDYAVGRIAFDNPEDYAKYARAIVEYEGGETVPAEREVVYWATRHPADQATQMSSDFLIKPLSEGEPAAAGLPAREPPASRYGYASRTFHGAQATKAALADIFRGGSRPSFLMTASHGMGGWTADDPRIVRAQGALLCQDWAGFGKVGPEHYLTADEIDPTVDFRGMIAFLFACYGAGTPQYDNYLESTQAGPKLIAPRQFVSALAQRLLAQGALAVFGHIERAWGYSIRPPKVGTQLLPFRNLISRVLSGEPIGHSTLDFSQRYATASVGLANLLDPRQPGVKQAGDSSLVRMWITCNDAQNYVVLGDPAARLREKHVTSPPAC